MFLNARLNQTTMLSGVMAPPRSDRMTWPDASRSLKPRGKRSRKIGMHRDQPAAAVLGRIIAKLDHIADVAAAIKHHVPGQVRDLAGAQSGLGRQQDDHSVTNGCRVHSAKIRRSATSSWESIFACLPSMRAI